MWVLHQPWWWPHVIVIKEVAQHNFVSVLYHRGRSIINLFQNIQERTRHYTGVGVQEKYRYHTFVKEQEFPEGNMKVLLRKCRYGTEDMLLNTYFLNMVCLDS